MKQKWNQSSLSCSLSLGMSAGKKGLLVGAGALVLFGLTRRSKAGLALASAGGVLAYRSARGVSGNKEESAKAIFLVNASPEKAYGMWRDFKNLPRFMSHLKSVRELGGGRSEWVALGPMDTEVRWTATLTEDTDGRLIAWQSEPGSTVSNSGRVEFREAPQGRGTMVTAVVNYTLPAGKAAKAFVTALGKNPEFVVREDVRRFKSLIEAGEAPTTAGQTHGPRGIHGKMEQVLFRETSNHPAPQAERELVHSA